MPCSAWTAAPPETEGPGDDTHGEGANGPGDFGHDGGATGSGPTTLAGGDEDHVGALEDILQLRLVLFSGRTADLGLAPAPRPWSLRVRCRA